MMMNYTNDFLFLADGELPFLMNSLRGMLENNGYHAGKCNLDLKDMESLEELPELFVVDANDLLSHTEERVYLYDRCIEESRKIVLIGNEIDVKGILRVTSTNVIGEIFRRPINNQEVTEKLEQMILAIREKGKKRRILVVDDNPTFLRLMAEWLEEDYNVSVCPSATAAFHIIETNKPDLILLDYEMPICNGAQFLQMLHSETTTAKIPVMFLTSKDDADTVKYLISLRPQGYLLKNRTKEKTLESIENFFIKEMAK